MRPKPALLWIHAFLSVNWVVNGVWMIFAPGNWYAQMPQAGDTGPLNEHFIRDYGSVFFLIGIATLLALARRLYSRWMHFWIFMFFVAHAALHVWDMFAGRLPHYHWNTGFILVMLPVAALGALLHPAAWRCETGHFSGGAP